MDDLISRQAAVEAMFANMPGLMFNDVLRILRTLPSAQPEKKTGKWYRPWDASNNSTRFKCSVCERTSYYSHGGNNRHTKSPVVCGYRFCPWCGAKMNEEVTKHGETH